MSVTLFKSGSSSAGDREASDDKFFRALRQANFTTKIIPVVAFEFCSLDILWRELQLHQHYEGLIFTSPRCVQSLKEAIELCDKESQWETSLKGYWIDKRMFCVGPSTVAEVVQFFSHNSEQQKEKIRQSDKGNSASLAETIIKENQNETLASPLLYPCGSLKTETLGELLNDNGIPFKAIVVYNTVKNPELERNPSEVADASAHSKQETEIYVFFSPSGINFALPHLTDLASKKFVAIGPTTREALSRIPSIPADNIYQCDSPTPEGLLAVLKSMPI